jgi:enoyl-CoA hydratase/carnithine racemase
MDALELVRYEIADRVATVTLDRPAKRNAINRRMRGELYRVFEDIRDNDEIWVAIITGGSAIFSAGHDLSEPLEGTPAVEDLYAIQQTQRKPLIAAISGACLAQGAGIALTCDIRIADETAFFAWPQVRRGIASISGPTMLARRIPLNLAMEFLLTGDTIDGPTAARVGLVNRVVPAGQALVEARAMAERIAANAPLAVRAMKEAVIRTLPLPALDAFRVATEILTDLEQTEDAQEGMRAFVEKREPVWRGR